MAQGQEQLGVGVTHINEAGEVLVQITTSVKAISERNTQIATAAEEQTSVTEEINRNVINIKDVVEQTAEGAEQVDSAASTVAERTTELRSLVSRFQL